MQPTHNSPERQARRILADVRQAYATWQAEQPVGDYPPAGTLFILPVPDVLRWFRLIAANLHAHGLYPDMQRLLLGVVDELEALGFAARQDN